MVLEFGVDLAKIGTTIQESIRDQILAMTGNHTKTIDVVIDDIKMDAAEKDSEEEKLVIFSDKLDLYMPEFLENFWLWTIEDAVQKELWWYGWAFLIILSLIL